MEFSYALSGAGWGVATVSDTNATVSMGTSFLSDVLGDLIQAVGTLLEGAPSARCSWELEPGEYRWIFNRLNGDVSVRILVFADAWSHSPDSEGRVVFETVGPTQDTARAIADGLSEVLEEHGEDGYRQLWIEHPFPTGSLRLVQGLLRDQECP
jgi:hypothetical protein